MQVVRGRAAAQLFACALAGATCVLACSSDRVPVHDGGAPGASGSPNLHRVSATTCPPSPPATSEPDPMLYESFVAPECKKNEDCTKGKNGICAGTIVFGTHCYYDECASDADCKTRTLCNCTNNNAGGRTSCLGSDCRVDADCGTGGYCTPNAECGYVDSFHCHHPTDTCFNDHDCTMQYQKCLFDRMSGWSCRVPRCAG